MESAAVEGKLRKNRINIINAIDIFLEKKDNSLKWQLEQEGFTDPDGTVESMNEYEERIADILNEQTEDVKKAAEDAKKEVTEPKRWDRMKNLIYWIAAGKTFAEAVKLLKAGKTCERAVQSAEQIAGGMIARNVAEETKKMLKQEVPRLANLYMKESDGELVVRQMRKRTSAWMEEWSAQLGQLMHITAHDQLTALIEDGIKNGKSVADVARKIQEEGFRNEYYQAHRVALTETLRAHSVAREESIQQSPAVTEKEWVHTGSHKNKPRENHIAISGQVKKKEETFDLTGADGILYHPKFPRDTILPAGESVNCHCTHRGIVDKNILDMSLEERKALQQKIIDEDDGAWERELDEKNKRKAGINEDTVNYDWIRKKSKEDQIKYFGGGYAGKQRWALLESGVIKDDEGIERMYKRSKSGRRTLKSIEELHKDGIITVRKDKLMHSVYGEFTVSDKFPNGRLSGGGHTQKGIYELEKRGSKYNIVKTYENGVRIGHIPDHKRNTKKGITTGKYKDSDIGQSWFPEDWDEDDVLVAGTEVVNKVKSDGPTKYGVVNIRGTNVKVGMYVDENGPTTIFPDNAEQPRKDGSMEKARE